jgi:hypothetical protein
MITRRTLGTMAVLAIMLATATVGWAQKKGEAASSGTPAPQFKQKTVYDFDDDVVEGDLVRPDGEFVDSRGRARHSSLIKLRVNFVPEMIKSAEKL